MDSTEKWMDSEQSIDALVVRGLDSREPLSIERVDGEWAVVSGSTVVYSHSRYAVCDSVLAEIEDARADIDY